MVWESADGRFRPAIPDRTTAFGRIGWFATVRARVN
jgi:hypothetical protein